MKLTALLAGHPHVLLRGSGDTDITRIVTDSRQTAPGCLFIALPGRRSDGHDHLAQAAARGAAAVLVSSTVHPLPDGPAAVRVADTRPAASLAAARLHGEPGRRMRVVAVTGTNGKTSVAAMLEAVLRDLEPDHPVGVIGTGGCRLDGAPVPLPTTTPTTPQAVELQAVLEYLADRRAGTVVMEASSTALAQHRVDHAGTDIGVFTNLTPDHLDDHGTMAEYRAAKLRLFAGLAAAAVVNADDPVSADIRALMPAATTGYGIDRPADFTARDLAAAPTGTRFTVVHDGREHPARLPVPGRFNVSNALAVIAVCHRLGHPVGAVLRALAAIPPIPGRMEALRLPGGATAVVDYAHSADSLEQALRTLRETGTGRLVTVFGCGGDRDPGKRAPMGRIAGTLSDQVVLTSDNPRTEDPEAILDAVERGVAATGTPYERIADRRAAIARALRLAGPADTVLIAGKGAEPYQLIGDRADPFHDLSVVRELAEVRSPDPA